MKKTCLFIAMTIFPSLVFSGGSTTFDGANSLINCGTLSDRLMREDQPLTVTFWMRPATQGEGSSAAFIGRPGGANGVGLRFIGVGTVRFRVQGGTNLTRTTNAFFKTGIWQYVALTWDGSITAANVHIYVSAVPWAAATEVTYAVTTNGATPTDNSASSLCVGNDVTQVATFDGQLSNIHVYDRILTKSEIDDTQFCSDQIANVGLNLPLFEDGLSFHDLSINSAVIPTATLTVPSKDGPPVMQCGVPL